MQSIEKILLNPFFIALPISILVILLLPPFFDKYHAEVVSKEYYWESKVYYHDLNGDSFSEKIRLHYNMNSAPGDSNYNAPAIQIDSDCSADKLAKTFEQYNFDKSWFKSQKVYFDDFDHDGLKEIYFYTYSNDSLFLNGLDVFNRNDFFLEKFICQFSYYNNQVDLVFSGRILFHDINRDGYKEIISTVNGGFTSQPRFVYAYDVINDSLISSETCCMNLSVTDVLRDEQAKVYIATSNYAPGNAEDSELPVNGYTDYSSWLVVLDKNLVFVFPPVENMEITSSVMGYLHKENDEIFLYAVFRSPQNNNRSALKKYQLDGIEMASKEFGPSVELGIFSILKNNKDEILLYDRRGRAFYIIDDFLNIIESKNIEFKNANFLDLDFDGSDELFNWQEGEDHAYIYTSNFSHSAKVDLKDMYKGFVLTPCRFKDNSANFAIHNGNFVYYFKYYKNPVYYFRFPFYTGIYLAISILFYIVMYFQRKALKSKFEQEKKVAQLELLTIKNQIDPHFIINAVNSLGAVIFKSNEDKKKSYKFLVNLTALIRDTLQNSQKVSLSLKEELDFVENYLQLQRFRYRNSFEFEVVNEIDNPKEVEIPKMIIQTFVENAVKHGLAHKTDGVGIILIDVSKINDTLRITVEDNGIGRRRASEVSTGSTGMGMEIIDQIVELYNRLKKTKVRFDVKDMVEKDEPVGTKVMIDIPLE